MKVFVAGATGAIGRPLVRQLLDAEHEVIALTRSVERAATLELLGVRAVVGDALAEGTLDRVFEQHRPEVAVHQLTTFPTSARPINSYRKLQQTNRLRSSGAELVMTAARRAGTSRVIAQGIAFLYEPGEPDRLRIESDPVIVDGPGILGGVARGIAAVERVVLDSPDVQGVVLRYGAWYGEGTQLHASVALRRLLRSRLVPALRGSTASVNLTLVDDAAAAVVAALTAPPGAYNVVDIAPIAVRELMDLVADACGARPPVVSATWSLRAAGAYVGHLLTRQVPVSNRRALGTLGWRPTHASTAAGLRAVLAP